MEDFDELAFKDLNGADELDELIDSQLQIKENDEFPMEVDILENLVFADHERTYNELNKRAAKQVIKAFNKQENGKKQ